MFCMVAFYKIWRQANEYCILSMSIYVYNIKYVQEWLNAEFSLVSLGQGGREREGEDVSSAPDI